MEASKIYAGYRRFRRGGYLGGLFDSPPVASAPAGKALCALCDFLGDDRFASADGQGIEADSTLSDAETDSTSPEVVSFADANLERVVRQALKKPQGPLTLGDLASLTRSTQNRKTLRAWPASNMLRRWTRWI